MSTKQMVALALVATLAPWKILTLSREQRRQIGQSLRASVKLT